MIAHKNDIFDLDFDDEPTMLTYNSVLDDDIIAVLKEHSGEVHWFEDTAKKLSMCPKYVELILHVLSNLDLVEYGTSPRSAWATETGKKYLTFRGVK